MMNGRKTVQFRVESIGKNQRLWKLHLVVVVVVVVIFSPPATYHPASCIVVGKQQVWRDRRENGEDSLV